MNNVSLVNIDCMEYMRNTEDGFFDLAIVDPPYGIGISKNPVRQAHEKKEWDNAAPEGEYFEELRRVSKNQIIWGGNYFLKYLHDTNCFIIWDKEQPEKFSMAMCEFAWTSFSSPAKIYRKRVVNADALRIHPTQKPVSLYKWIMGMYAEKGQRILDTHLGSGSSAIAAHYFGCDFVGCELDKDYYEAMKARFKKETAQRAMF